MTHHFLSLPVKVSSTGGCREQSSVIPAHSSVCTHSGIKVGQPWGGGCIHTYVLYVRESVRGLAVSAHVLHV